MNRLGLAKWCSFQASLAINGGAPLTARRELEEALKHLDRPWESVEVRATKAKREQPVRGTRDGTPAIRTSEGRPLSPGLHRGLSMADYQRIDALGSGRLGDLATSPLEYRYRFAHPEPETEATRLGTALHVAVLEPERFEQLYACEPDVEKIGGAKPRATNAYREACAELEASGRIVLRTEPMTAVLEMALAVRRHPHAAAVLAKAPEREVTALWDRDGRLCRARVDILGDGIAADLKTTRDLARFSPWEIVKHGYHVQAGHYTDGLRRLGREVRHYFLIAVDSAAPHDVGVFVFDDPTLAACQLKCDWLFQQLAECEAADRWPGQFPDVVPAQLPEALVAELAEEEVA